MREIVNTRLVQEFEELALTEKHRPIRLRLEPRLSDLNKILMVQRVEYSSVMCGGIHAYLTCVTNHVALPTKTFIGLSVEVQIVTDKGELQTLCGIVKSVRAGQSDGALSVMQLELVDALTLMEECVESRVFIRANPVTVIDVLYSEWRRRCPALASCFHVDTSNLRSERYPQREFILQWNEGSGHFIKRLLKQAGIAWFIRSGAPSNPQTEGKGTSGAGQTLVLFDWTESLSANAAGPLRYHRHDGTEERDSIILWSPHRRLVAGSVERNSWDYKPADMNRVEYKLQQGQGAEGDSLARLLRNHVIEPPHAGDNWDDHRNLTTRRLQRLEFEAKCVDGISGVRQMNCGEWNEISGHPDVDNHPVNERKFVFVEVHHHGENNLPKSIDEQARTLLASSQQLPGWVTQSAVSGPSRHYMNRFKAVRCTTPIVPPWNPEEDFPRMTEVTGIVGAAEGQEVQTDELGRVRVRIAGLRVEDHSHANGAGTKGFNGDSAWIRVGWGWAGSGFGNIQPLRAGMEVAIGFEGGDPSRPFISRVLYNGRNKPPAFSHRGGLPTNSRLSGTKTREIKGQRYNQLRFDDTSGQISSQLASEHAHSQLNLGHLVQPRVDGHGEARGEGAELRTDESLSVRSAKALLISAWKQLEAKDKQLSRDEYLSLMQECLDLFKALGRYAGEHQGSPLDDKPQAEIQSHVKHWEAGTNTNPQGDVSQGGKPVIGITAPAGISQATPKTLLSYAGVNIDTVAGQHFQCVAGQRYSVTSGQGIGLFAQNGGLKAIAHQGRLQLQSQHDDTLIDSAKDLQARAAEDLLLTGKSLTFIADDGSYMKIGNGIELGTKEGVSVKSAKFQHAGPASLTSDKADFSKGAPDQKFVLKYGSGADAMAAANRRFKLTLSDGTVQEGISDAQGKTSLLAPDAMQIADIQIFKD